MTPGDVVLFYTDGLVESQNSRGEYYGQERLAAALGRLRRVDLRAMRKEILRDIESFRGEETANDDMTMILMRREVGSTIIIRREEGSP